MPLTYTWKVTGLKTKDEGPNARAVVQTYWEKTGTDSNGSVGKFSGATPFTSANVPSELFVPFNELTEEIVLGWIQSVVVGSYEQHVNEQIQKQIDAAANPVVEATLPWALEPVSNTVAPAPIANTVVSNSNTSNIN